MKRLFAALALLLGVGVLITPVSAQDKRAKEILDKVDDMWRSTASHTVMSMTVQTEHYKRTMAMEAWSKGKKKSLVRITSPRKEKGTATLMADNHIYTYLPKTDRTIRLTSGMMQGSWMGSHFTNDDLVKESRLAEDYDFSITSEGKRDGRQAIEITLTPKRNAAVTWGKVVYLVEDESFIPLSAKYYDEDGRLVRTMTFSKVRELGGRKIPTVLTLVPTEDPDEYTRVVYEDADFDIDLPDSRFSKAALKRR